MVTNSARWRSALFGLVGAGMLLVSALPVHANLGFEDDLSGWTVVPTPADAVQVVSGCEGFGCATTAPVYEQYNIQVPTAYGTKMARLGTPQEGNQKQYRGPNTIISDPITIAANTPYVRVAFRLFSYEFRAADKFVIEVLGASTARVETLAGSKFALGSAGQCASAGPLCDITINVAKTPKAPRDTGWVSAYIRGVAAGTTIQLRYTLIADDNESQPSWIYADAYPLPVSASLFFSPGKANEGGIASEGDTLFFDCASAGLSVNPNGGSVDCHWKATGGGLVDGQQIDGPFAMFWFPDNNNPAVELTVSDPADPGNTQTIKTGVGGVSAINLLNRAPKVVANDLEVLTGGSGEVRCWFLDPGIGQISGGKVTAPEITSGNVAISGGSGLTVDIEYEPAFTSGIATATVTTVGEHDCTVTDHNDESGQDKFWVIPKTVAEIQAREPAGGNDTTQTATPFGPGVTRLAYLSDSLDIDVYEVQYNGATPPPGSEVYISVKPPGADYDLIVLAETFSTTNPAYIGPLVTAPLYSGNFSLTPQTAPLYSGSTTLGGISRSPLYSGNLDLNPRTSPLYSGSGLLGTFTTAPLYSGSSVGPGTLQISPLYSGFDTGRITPSSVPLSEFPSANSGSLGTTDVNWTELGSQNLQDLQADDIEVVAVSAALGDATEQVLVRVVPGTKKLFFAVVATAGAQSTDPYAATTTISVPESQKSLLTGTTLCNANHTFDASHTALGTATLPTSGTLLITQRERFLIANGIDPTDPDDVWGDIEAALPAGTTLVSVPGAWYAAADQDPCDIAKWRALAAKIKSDIVGDPSRFDAVGIIGGADVLPPFFLPDTATVGNERYYTDIMARAGSLVAVATLEGNAEVYGCYGDVAALSYLGGELCVEDVPVFVLVETPDQVLAKINAATAPPPSSDRVAFGYPPFDDGLAQAAAAADVFNVLNVTDPTDQSSWWTAASMRTNYLACELAGAAPELTILNAHMNPNAALSAAGDLAPDPFDFTTAEEVQNCLVGNDTLSLGCHSAMDIPSTMALSNPVFPYDPKVNWTDRLTSLVGPTGFGLGSNGGVQLTEKLIALLAGNLNEGLPLGGALVKAKQDHLLSLQQVDPHDAKAITNLTLFGWPSQTLAGAAAPALFSLAAITTSCGDDFLNLDILRDGSTTDPKIFDGTLGYCLLTDLDRGSWYTLEGEAQSTYPRPLLPVFGTASAEVFPTTESGVTGLWDLPHSLVQVDRSQTAGLTWACPAGAVCAQGIAGSFVDEPDTDIVSPHFDPVFPLPQTNWSNPREGLESYEPYACIEVFSPTQLGAINALPVASSTLWTAVVTGAQFRCDATETIDGIDRAVGTKRLWTSLAMDAVFPRVNPGDFVRPKIEQLDVTAYPATGDVVAQLRATDENTGDSGIIEIILLVFHDPVPPLAGFVESYSVQGALDGQTVTITAPNAYGKRLAAWGIDGAGNANYKSLKGQLFEAIPVDILALLLPGGGGGAPLRILIGGFECLSLPTVTIDYSDGRPSQFIDLTSNQGYTVEYVGNGDCRDAIITIPQDFGVVGDAGITVTATVRAGGGVGSDSLTIFACRDPQGDSSLAGTDILACSFSKSGTSVTITATMLGNIDPNSQYRVELPQFGALFKLWDCGTSNCKKSSSPTGVTLKKNGVVSGKTITFQFDLAALGWNGLTPISFKIYTQGGIAGSPSEGFPDETQVFTGS